MTAYPAAAARRRADLRGDDGKTEVVAEGREEGLVGREAIERMSM